MPEPNAARIEPWSAEDFPLLEQLLGDPAMTEHLGGPESHDQLVDRQQRYEQVGERGTGQMYAIVDETSGLAVGSVGYWDREWGGESVYETGWSVIPAFQGRGIAGAGTALVIDAARTERTYRFMYAFPSIDNLPSNAICRKLGFTLLEQREFEYPAGHFMRCNVWRLELFDEDYDPARSFSTSTRRRILPESDRGISSMNSTRRTFL